MNASHRQVKAVIRIGRGWILILFKMGRLFELADCFSIGRSFARVLFRSTSHAADVRARGFACVMRTLSRFFTVGVWENGQATRFNSFHAQRARRQQQQHINDYNLLNNQPFGDHTAILTTLRSRHIIGSQAFKRFLRLKHRIRVGIALINPGLRYMAEEPGSWPRTTVPNTISTRVSHYICTDWPLE